MAAVLSRDFFYFPDFSLSGKNENVNTFLFFLFWKRFYERQRVLAVVEASVCVSVCLSQSAFVSKRCKRGLRNIHHGL